MSVATLPLTAAASKIAQEQKELAKANKSKLHQHEAIILRSEQAFLLAAKSVVQIVDERLFKPWYGDKSSYFKDRWDMTPQNLTRLENSGRVLIALEDAGYSVLPRNEGQARELYHQCGGDLEKVVALWKAVVDTGEKISAKLIAGKGQELFPDAPKTETSPQEENPDTSESDVLSMSRITSKRTATIRLGVDVEDGWGSPLEFDGSPFVAVGEDQYELALSGNTNKELLEKLAGWAQIENVKILQISIQ